MAKEGASLLLIGLGVGYYVPALPAPLTEINPYIGMAFILLAIVIMVRG